MRSGHYWLLIPLMLVLSMNFSFAQEKLLSGKVVDQDNIPLPGVSVLVVGTTRGAQTDFDGKIELAKFGNANGIFDEVLLDEVGSSQRMRIRVRP